MKNFRFGEVRVKVLDVRLEPAVTGGIVEIDAPGVEPFSFYLAHSKLEPDELARGAMLHLLDAWMHPNEFVTRRVRQAIEGASTLLEQEEIGAMVRAEATDTARFASTLDPFMSGVQEALWKLAKVRIWGKLPGRGPREWLPGRK